MTALEPMTFRWRLRVMMAERGIHTVTELRRRLEPLGVEISTQQLNRIVTDLPQRLNTDLFAALLTVLRCTPNDLFAVDSERPSPAEGKGWKQDIERAAPPPRKRAVRRKVEIPSIADEELLGPKVMPFPLPERKEEQ